MTAKQFSIRRIAQKDRQHPGQTFRPQRQRSRLLRKLRWSGSGPKRKNASLLVTLLRLFVVGVIVVSIAVLTYLGWLWSSLPDISDRTIFLASQSTTITDRHGTELYRLFEGEDRTQLPADAIPQDLKNAIISIEDERYFERGCLDIRALIRAVVGMGRSGGASTLTRQLARNALGLQQENVYNRKLKELMLGCSMEDEYSKDELLALYLNWIPFGQNAYGVEQASKEYFGASGTGLTLAQSSVLAALPQRPTYFSPYGSHVYTTVTEAVEEGITLGDITATSQVPDDQIAIGLIGSTFGTGSSTLYIGGRTDQVLRNMQDQGYITDDQRIAALDELQTIEFKPLRADIRAPHFVLGIREQVEEMFAGTAEEGLLERGGLLVETTLDLELQRIAEDVIAFHKQDMLDRFGAHNISLVSVHPETREVLAYIGNADFSDEEFGGKIDMASVPRQPGSSFKPFVYAAAFEQGYSPATVLFDVKTKIGEDEPQNFDGQFMGPMSIRQALGSSRNIPAAKAFFLGKGEESILQLVASMGAPTPLQRKVELAAQREGGFDYGWPLSLGAAETPLVEMVHAYSTLASGGQYRDLITIRRISDRNGNILFSASDYPETEQVLDPRIAYQVTSVLSDESARPDPYWKSQLTIPGFQTAAKTGTSNKCLEWTDAGICRLRKPDNAWLVGYTPELVAGVWVGNADSSALFETAGGLNSASPIWRDFLTRAHRTIDATRTQFDVPEGVVQPQVSLLSGDLASECTPVELRKADIFLREYAPKEYDRACKTLTVDKLTGLLASDACPEEAQEEASFFHATSILPDRWPTWEEGVQGWMTEQMEIWNASETHSGSLLVLPQAPVDECDPSLTPGRLIEPEVEITSPKEGGIAAYPAFQVRLDLSVGSSVQNVEYRIDGKRVASIDEPPFTSTTLRVPGSVKQTGLHTLEVFIEDEYFNKATHSVTFRFGEDTSPPEVEFISPDSRITYEKGSTVLIAANADDDEGGVKYVQFYLDNVLLTTKPREPYQLEFELDVDEGQHTLRAVAIDEADLEAEDTVRITVGDTSAPAPVQSSSSSSAAQEPEEEEEEEILNDASIVSPGVQVNASRDEVIDFSINVPPTLDWSSFNELMLVVRRDGGGSEDLVLRISSGEGTYKRQWKAKTPGTYTAQLLYYDRTGDEEEVVDTVSIEVE